MPDKNVGKAAKDNNNPSPVPTDFKTLRLDAKTGSGKTAYERKVLKKLIIHSKKFRHSYL